MKRRYELKRRAERQAETRKRITEAAVELHTTVGPAATTIAAIAARAGVQRHTVYAHFPDERSLFDACSSHWTERHPFPDTERWLQEPDPEQRLRTALDELYRWYEAGEGALSRFHRDASLHPVHGELMAAQTARIRELAVPLARGWPTRKTVRAAIGHALEFETWRSLVRAHGLSRRQATEAMVRLAASV